MKYLRFSWNRYFPFGGMDDCHGEYDTLEEAQAAEPNPYGTDEIWRADETGVHWISTYTHEGIWSRHNGTLE